MKKVLLWSLLVVFTNYSCINKQKENKLSNNEKELFIETGSVIANKAFGALSSTLQNAYTVDGVQGAIKYCSLKAHPIIDSISKDYNVRIKRTSLQIRNHDNNPTDYEKEVLYNYEDQFEKGEDLLPQVKMLENGNVVFFSPIKIITPLCLNCHGKLGETLHEENYKVIHQLYPNDQAIGYELNDLRGIWSISFESTEAKN